MTFERNRCNYDTLTDKAKQHMTVVGMMLDPTCDKMADIVLVDEKYVVILSELCPLCSMSLSDKYNKSKITIVPSTYTEFMQYFRVDGIIIFDKVFISLKRGQTGRDVLHFAVQSYADLKADIETNTGSMLNRVLITDYPLYKDFKLEEQYRQFTTKALSAGNEERIISSGTIASFPIDYFPYC